MLPQPRNELHLGLRGARYLQVSFSNGRLGLIAKQHVPLVTVTGTVMLCPAALGASWRDLVTLGVSSGLLCARSSKKSFIRIGILLYLDPSLSTFLAAF